MASDREREERAFEALIVMNMRSTDNPNLWPELTAEERAAMDALPPFEEIMRRAAASHGGEGDDDVTDAERLSRIEGRIRCGFADDSASYALTSDLPWLCEKLREAKALLADVREILAVCHDGTYGGRSLAMMQVMDIEDRIDSFLLPSETPSDAR